jgi:hypothetical protein
MSWAAAKLRPCVDGSFFFSAFTAANRTATNTPNGPRKLWLVFAALRRGWNSLMILQRTRKGEFIINDPDCAPNIRRPRTRALPEQ